MGMDTTDRKIAVLLQRHGRMSYEHVAQAIGLSRSAVYERVRRLENAGVIKSFEAVVDWGALGKPVTAFISVRTGGTCNDTGLAILALADEDAFVEECHRITGEWCMLVKVRVATPLALQDLIDRIRAVPGVQGTMTTVALSALHEERDISGKARPRAAAAAAGD